MTHVIALNPVHTSWQAACGSAESFMAYFRFYASRSPKVYYLSVQSYVYTDINFLSNLSCVLVVTCC